MQVDTNLSHWESIPGNQTCALSSCFVRPSWPISIILCLSVSGTSILSPLTTIPSTTASLLKTSASSRPLSQSISGFLQLLLSDCVGHVAYYNTVHVTFLFFGSSEFVAQGVVMCNPICFPFRAGNRRQSRNPTSSAPGWTLHVWGC